MERTMESKGKIRIYIADKEEEKEIFDYFRKNDKFSLVGTSDNGESVLKDVILLKPDVLVMEVVLSGLDGFDVLEKLKFNLKPLMKVQIILWLSLFRLKILKKEFLMFC